MLRNNNLNKYYSSEIDTKSTNSSYRKSINPTQIQNNSVVHIENTAGYSDGVYMKVNGKLVEIGGKTLINTMVSGGGGGQSVQSLNTSVIHFSGVVELLDSIHYFTIANQWGNVVVSKRITVNYASIDSITLAINCIDSTSNSNSSFNIIDKISIDTSLNNIITLEFGVRFSFNCIDIRITQLDSDMNIVSRNSYTGSQTLSQPWQTVYSNGNLTLLLEVLLNVTN